MGVVMQVVVSAPILHLFVGVGKRQEPVLVQALGPKAAVEGVNISIVGGLAGAGEVQRHVFGILSQIQVAAVFPPCVIGWALLRSQPNL